MTEGGGWTGKRTGPKPRAKKATTPAVKPTTQTTNNLPNALTPRGKKTRAGRSIGQSSRARGKAADEKRSREVMTGRYQTKISREVIGKLEQALSSGMAPVDAAPFAGIARSTFHDWMQRGRMEGADALYVELVEMVEMAVSRWATGLWTALTTKARAGDASVRDILEALERRGFADPRKTIAQIGNENGDPFKVLTANFDVARLASLSDEELTVFHRVVSVLAEQERDDTVIDR